MKSLLLITLILSSSAWARDCVIFSLGGMADEPYKEPNESRHITRMNYVGKQGKDLGCKVFKAHNKSYEDLMKDMEKFVKDNKIDKSYKIHFSFSDHGSGEKIPLASGNYVTPDKFFTGVNKFIPAGSHVTYASHICWGGNLMKAANNGKYGFDLCGGSSVDIENLSSAWNNPRMKKNESLEDYNKRKFAKREIEYLGAGWKVARDKNPTYFGYRPYDNPVSILEYHYEGIGVDTTNAMRGSSLSSVLMARDELTNLGEDPYLHLNYAIEYSPDFYNDQEYSSASILSQFKDAKGKKNSCSIDNGLDIGGAPLEDIGKSIGAILDTNKIWLSKNQTKYPFLKKFKHVLNTEREKTSNLKLMSVISGANETYKKEKARLQPMFDISEDTQKLEHLTKQIVKDRKLLSSSDFSKKYKKYFGDKAEMIREFNPANGFTLNDEIQFQIQSNIYREWEKTTKKIKKQLKPIVKRVRIENDIAMMRKFLNNKNISETKKKKFIRMAKCEVKSFI